MREQARTITNTRERVWTVTHGELEAATPPQRRAFYRALLAQWAANEQRQRQLDLEADQRAFERRYIDEPGPIDDAYPLQSSTSRTAKP